MPPEPTAALRPLAGERGLASYDAEFLAERLAGAWQGLLALAERADLRAPSRLPGWSAHDVLVHLGSWPDQPVLTGLLTAAREDIAPGPAPSRADQDRHNAAVLAAHRGDSREDVLAALRAGRDGTLEFLATDEADALARRLVGSVLGPLPLLALINASAYELAVHALDLAPALPAGTSPPPALLHTGLAALVDVTAALAARSGIEASGAVVTPEGGWAFASAGGDWTVIELERGVDTQAKPPPGGVVEAPADLVLDVSAGRVAVPPLLVSRRLRVHDVPALLTLAPIVESVPGLPGGSALRVAGRYLSGAGRHLGEAERLLGRLARRLRG